MGAFNSAKFGQIQCVLFDLDGTLLDTAPDMIHALNRVLTDEQREPLPAAQLRNQVSHGSAALVEFVFGKDQSPKDFEDRKQRFLSYYQNRLCVDTVLFPGMAKLLDNIQAQGLSWGVVTNKPGWLTDPLMEQAGLMSSAVCVISGDSTAERKPHPLPMLVAAKLANADPANCLYVGDAERDIAAGNAANMTTVIANYGYIDAEQRREEWGADGNIDHALELDAWIRPHKAADLAG